MTGNVPAAFVNVGDRFVGGVIVLAGFLLAGDAAIAASVRADDIAGLADMRFACIAGRVDVGDVAARLWRGRHSSPGRSRSSDQYEITTLS
jgi:hypothetical protein